MIAELSPFRKLYTLGYTRLVPIVPPDAEVSPKSSLAKRLSSRGKAVGIRGDDGLWRGFDWLRSAPPSIDELDRWQAMGAGVGIRTGAGLVALDIDSLDPFIAKRAVALAEEMLGFAPVRVGRAPKCLLVYRTEGEVNYQRVEFSGHEGKPERIELLSDGRQFVAEGIHPATHKPYTWPETLIPTDMLATVTAKQLDAYFSALASSLPKAVKAELTLANDRTNINQDALIGDAALVQAAVNALPNTAELFPTYDDYIRVGAAIKGATQHDPNHGLELFLEWCSRWDGGENDPESAAADYARIKPPYEIGAGWLYDHADRYSGGNFSVASAWFEPVAENDNPFSASTSAAVTAPNTHDRIKLLSIKEARALAASHSRRYLIKGLLDQGAMTILYGPSNVGKTFVAMDIAFHIAAGMPYAGMRTHQTPVVYIAAEGGRGAADRLEALIRKYGHEDAPFFLILYSVDLLHKDADLPSLVAAINAACPNPGLIVVDTLSRAIAGGDENSSTDMGALVANLDALRSKTSAHCLVVHHSGKDAAKGARGHSLLRAATDTEIEIADGCIKVTKQRDMDGNFVSNFKLDIWQLRTDADGDPITSCTVAMVAAGEAEPVETATPAEREVLDVIHLLIDVSDGAKGAKMKDILSALHESKPNMTSENVRSILRRLGTKRLVQRVDKGLWAPKSGQNALTATIPERFSENEAVKSGQKSGQTVFD